MNSIRAKIIISSLCKMKSKMIYDNDNDNDNERKELIDNCYFHDNYALNDRELQIIEKSSLFQYNSNSNVFNTNSSKNSDDITVTTTHTTRTHTHPRYIQHWNILCNSLSGLIECRKIDIYHSLSVHRISTIIGVLTENNIHPPEGFYYHPFFIFNKSMGNSLHGDVIAGNTSSVIESSSSLLPLSTTSTSQSEPLSNITLIDLTNSDSNNFDLVENQNQNQNQNQNPSLIQKDISKELMSQSQLQFQIPKQVLALHTERKIREGGPDSTDFNDIVSNLPSVLNSSTSEQIKSNIDNKNLGPTSHMEISAQYALLELSKLFDKKRSQIVALWCVETATNGGERILQRTYKFDSLRRKFLFQYFKLSVLCKNLNPILTVLTWILSVNIRKLTATIRWMISEAVLSSYLILKEKYLDFKKSKDSFHLLKKFNLCDENILEENRRMRVNAMNTVEEVQYPVSGLISSVKRPQIDSVFGAVEEYSSDRYIIKNIPNNNDNNINNNNINNNNDNNNNNNNNNDDNNNNNNNNNININNN